MNISVPEKSSYKFDWPSFVDKKLRNCIDMNVQLELSKNVTNYAFFIDNRPIPYIDVIIKNMMLHLGTDWGLCLYIDPSNEDYYKKIAEDHFINPDQIVWIINDLSNFNAIEYSTLFMDISFWEALPGERILIFHADSWMLKNDISDYLKYDYVGAPWSWHRKHDKVGGNGGFTLRNKSVMINILKKRDEESNEVKKFGYNDEVEKEDVFFSNTMMQNEGYVLPEYNVAKKFSTETMYYHDPIGFHQVYDKYSYERFYYLFRNYDIDMSAKTLLNFTGTTDKNIKKIPMVIWQTCHLDVYQKHTRNAKMSLIVENDCDYILHTPERRDQFVNMMGSPELVKIYNEINWIHLKNWVWKMLVLFRFGGIVIDPRISCLKNFKELILENDEGLIINSKVMMFCKGHMLIKNLITNFISNYNEKTLEFIFEIQTEEALYDEFTTLYESQVQQISDSAKNCRVRKITEEEWSQYFAESNDVDNELKLSVLPMEAEHISFVKQPVDPIFNWKAYQRLSDAYDHKFVLGDIRSNSIGIARVPICLKGEKEMLGRSTFGYTIGIVVSRNSATYCLAAYENRLIRCNTFDIWDCDISLFGQTNYGWKSIELSETDIESTIPSTAYPICIDPWLNTIYLCRYRYNDNDGKRYDLGFFSVKQRPMIYDGESVIMPSPSNIEVFCKLHEYDLSI
jgi:mannosyltransferase OCH1-like enzyme